MLKHWVCLDDGIVVAEYGLRSVASLICQSSASSVWVRHPSAHILHPCAGCCQDSDEGSGTKRSQGGLFLPRVPRVITNVRSVRRLE